MERHPKYRYKYPISVNPRPTNPKQGLLCSQSVSTYTEKYLQLKKCLSSKQDKKYGQGTMYEKVFYFLNLPANTGKEA